jgi:DNA uptake protein ComE-like DNA-binding protein
VREVSLIDDLLDILNQYHNSSLYVGRAIPDKKLRNVIEHFPLPKGEEVIALVDATVFGSCKYGLAICREGMYVNNSWTSRIRKGFITWNEFKKANIKKIDTYEVEINENFTVGLAGSALKPQKLIEILEHIQSYLNGENEYARNPHVKIATPSSPPPLIKKQDEQWMIAIEGKQYGPYDKQTIKHMIHSKQIKPEETYVWKRGMENWEILIDIEEFQDEILPIPPAPSLPSKEKKLTEKVELNEASLEELLSLPGVNMEKARVFLEQRERKNGFHDYNEVREVLRVQPHQFEKIRATTKLKPIGSTTNSGRVIDF